MYTIRLHCFACYLLHSSFYLGSFFHPEDGGEIFLRNVSLLSTDYTMLNARRLTSSLVGWFIGG
jgi:hypothetical protein